MTRAEINTELYIPGKTRIKILENIPLVSSKPTAKVILKMAKSQRPPIDVLNFLNNASHEVKVTPGVGKELTTLSTGARPTLRFELKVWTEQRKDESLSYPIRQDLDQGTVYSWRKLSERACTKKGLLGQVYLGSLYPTLEINNSKLTLTNNSYLHRFPIILQYSCNDDLKKYIGVTRDNDENYIVVTSSTYEQSTTLLKKMNIGATIIAIYVAIITIGGITFIRPALLNKAQYCWVKKSPDAQVLLMIPEGMSSARRTLNFFREKKLFYRLIDLLRSPKKMVGITGSFLTIRKNHFQTRLARDHAKRK